MSRAAAQRVSAVARAFTSLAGIAVVIAPLSAWAAPVVTSADVQVAFDGPTACTVGLTLDVDANTVEHRIEVADGATIDLLGIAGARPHGEATNVGRTRALILEPESGRYTLNYRVTQPAHRAGRCPLWIPTIPTAGRGRAVRITVRIPPGATAMGTMPTFDWTGEQGTVAINHLPAFVRVPHALAGEPAPWNVARIMDVTAIATLLAATVIWTRRRRR
jgi:hypothetical protein